MAVARYIKMLAILKYGFQFKSKYENGQPFNKTTGIAIIWKIVLSLPKILAAKTIPLFAATNLKASTTKSLAIMITTAKTGIVMLPKRETNR